MLAIRLLLAFSCLISAQSTLAGSKAWDQTLWNAATKTRVSAEEKQLAFAPARTFVIGEEHYNPPVQAAEAALLQSIAQDIPNKETILLGWEFLNTEDQARIEQSYAHYVGKELTTEEFLKQLFPVGTAPSEYAPVMEAIRAVDGWLIPTNLSRAQKTPVTREGIEALDPALRPKDFEIGGANYFERFQEAMGPHPLPYPIENYFASQSLTDEVMATELLEFPTDGRRVLITGSFHGDYRDGVVASIARRNADKILYIKVLDASYYTEAELLELFVHPKYGPIADLVYVVNEPAQSK